MDLDVATIARAYLDRYLPERTLVRPALRTFDERFCREVGAWYDWAQSTYDPPTARAYDLFKRESRAQYETIVAAGVRVEPWLDRERDQPYLSSTELCRSVRETGVLYVYLTANGHGAGPGGNGDHPMHEDAGIRIHGVEFCYNDLFRAVHDFFGHVMHGNSFGPRGEFKATYDHMQMYSDAIHPVLAAETICQVCWFFYGPHLSGVDDPPVTDRPYSEQKTLLLPKHYMERYRSFFERNLYDPVR